MSNPLFQEEEPAASDDTGLKYPGSNIARAPFTKSSWATAQQKYALVVLFLLYF